MTSAALGPDLASSSPTTSRPSRSAARRTTSSTTNSSTRSQTSTSGSTPTPGARAIVLCSEGRHFCAGADFSAREKWSRERLDRQASRLYVEAVRVFSCTRPVVAAVQGAAVGGGLGLALSADFRIACEESRFVANFARLGIHQGFGLSVTLPRLIGRSRAALMLYTGRRESRAPRRSDGACRRARGPRRSAGPRARSRDRDRPVRAPRGTVDPRHPAPGAGRCGCARPRTTSLPSRAGFGRTADHEEGVKATAERRLGDFKGR